MDYLYLEGDLLVSPFPFFVQSDWFVVFLVYSCIFYRGRGFFSKITKRIRGEQSPCTGHFEILRPDGTTIPVNSEDQNCLYHAVAQATGKNPGDVGKEARILREQVRNNVSLTVIINMVSVFSFFSN